MKRFTDVTGLSIRLTDERREHIESRPEMEGQLPKIEATLEDPDEGSQSSQRLQQDSL